MQRRLLRILLWMLALAGASGVLAIFVSTAFMGRVAGTAVITAVACGLAMPVSRRLDDPKKRAGGLVGLSAIVAGFLSGVGAVWIEAVVRAWDLPLRLGLSALLIVVAGMVAAPLVGWARGSAGRWAALAALGLDAVSFAALLGAIWSDPVLRTGESITVKLAESGGWIAAAGAPGVLGLIGAGLRDRAWRWLAVGASAACVVMSLAGIWVVPSSDPTVFIGVMSLAVSVGYANAGSRIPLGAAGPWVRLAAFGSTAVLGGCVTAMSYSTQGFKLPGGDLLGRVGGASAIVCACSTVAMLVMYRLNRRVPTLSADARSIAAVNVECPHCGKKRAAAVGDSACPGCGLGLAIRVVEPRCANCDYPLLGIKGGRCPECGAEPGLPAPAA